MRFRVHEAHGAANVRFNFFKENGIIKVMKTAIFKPLNTFVEVTGNTP